MIMPASFKKISFLALLCPFLFLLVGAALAQAPDLKVTHPASVSAGEPFLLQVEPAGAQAPGELVAIWQNKRVPLSRAVRGKGQASDQDSEQPGGQATDQSSDRASGQAGDRARVETGEGSGPDAAAERLECILAVPLNCTDKSLTLRIVESASDKLVYSAPITVTQRNYPAQKLTVEPKYVNPDPHTAERAKKEAQKNRAILGRISPERYWRLPLLRPVGGIITSEYGFRRVFNGEPRSPHRGVDFRGAEGTPIKAGAAGRVMLAEEQHYSGKLVIIDHGQGVFSQYAHLSAFEVKVGDYVDKGQVIGLVGKTGRVTGPHLHFGFTVLGETVTPEPLMQGFRLKDDAPRPPLVGAEPAVKK